MTAAAAVSLIRVGGTRLLKGGTRISHCWHPHCRAAHLQFIIRQCSPERLSQQLSVLAAVARQLRCVVQAHDGARAVAGAERLQAVCCAQPSQCLTDEVHLRAGSQAAG
eukprot:GHRQ01027521.1.p2 GENE.GHRQ01027521.1~~GHRQ01027521.1.p2  ORF type:complete len:109 (+),score=26.61 GHRQ01027521.1:143-469(+)